MVKKKVIAYYDGSNFYHALKYNYGILSINFNHMAIQLLNLEKEELIRIKYYNSPINRQEDPIKYATQQRFFQKLRQTPLLELFLGDLVRRPLNKININCPICGHQKCDCLKCPKCERELDIKKCFRFTEKGVDVRLAINLLLDALDNRYDVALLFSGDADYSPAIKYVIKQLKKDVIYCHFPRPRTSELLQTCSGSRLITKEMVEKSQIERSK